MASVIARTALVNSARQRTVTAALSSSSICREWNNSTAAAATTTHSHIGQAAGTANLQLQRRNLSSPAEESKPGLFDRMKNKLSEREQKKQADKYAEQLEKMSNLETWNLKTFSDEINESMSSWRMKIPGMSNVQQVKAIKDQQKVIDGIKAVVGGDGTAADLSSLGRKEKLKISLTSDIPVQDINMLIQQFQSMDVMHKILRHRKKEGKEIPTDEQGLKTLIQRDGKNILTRDQKKSMKKGRSKAAMRGLR